MSRVFLSYQLGRELMNTKKVFYLLILLALIYNMMLMFVGCSADSENSEKVTLDIKTNLIEQK
ncbi:hypothetical protein [uncultured Algoriphagus sp.]|uniref:hypothetical protein n=1 Tax=uncultured Algoriphagus sp. TaxID=417365 RepID=UPI0030EC7107|tara:strand:+ start:51309 stop:51497 length:189 start_codon:yes stop_codon:yes gene_type:complete